jgi:hypothetical protein
MKLTDEILSVLHIPRNILYSFYFYTYVSSICKALFIFYVCITIIIIIINIIISLVVVLALI